ncbi:DNA repair protein RecN [Alicyclobacillus fastidiosus]|uniref:DNA repair protein RecN n=1 Tax=Alicyclobacillus fastidiosus TaxID=392011 RepID=A0ABV5AGE4_9BACL|nr:DNA repair protein RecN [Alicyclobacillus fastidiosus]WEH11729.1 DNA repair protein RecN [Alicyclobacillus fastidiosus]
MLTELYVENFVLIDSLRLEFGRGLHVFTGETGAGKSLLLDATRLALGGRASAASIQRGADHALVEAVFEVEANTPAARILADWEVDLDENTVIVSRSLYVNGRSTCRVNGRTVTVQMLKTLGDALVEMQGQHESQAMLTSRYQRTLIDLYGQHLDLVESTALSYRRVREARERLEAAQVSERERAQQIDILQFQIQEIEAADVTAGEEESLRAERQRLVAFEKFQSHVDEILSALEDPMHGAIAQLSVALHGAAELSIKVSDLEQVHEMISAAKANAEEAAFTTSKFASRLDVDPSRIQEIEDRLVAIRTLTRKYGPTLDDVLSHLMTSKAALNALMKHDEVIDACREELRDAQQAYLRLAERLSRARQEAAKRLQVQVQARLHDLHMNDARFEVSVTSDPDQWMEDGVDLVEFLFSGNPGEALAPLQKVASGGELSRTLLALKVVVADLEQVDTLIFDEIDAGVSGEAAQRVATMLRALGEHRQVLCVTHSAQVAAAGHEHFQIVKEMLDGRAHTVILGLDFTSRRDEIGRLLGAGVSDDTALRHADALLESFRKDTIAHT